MLQLDTCEPPEILEMSENDLLDEMVFLDVMFGLIGPPEDNLIEFDIF